MDSLTDSKGQLSIFLGITLVSVMALTAFVVNVGLFVKAKINLQNAVDAAAWTGAAVQARQLSNIAYVNYQFRQIYKEWMLKYYIFGNIGGFTRTGSNLLTRRGPGDVTNFRLQTNSYTTGGTADREVDKFNVPSICITNTNDNICSTVSVPGLPRFDTVHLAGGIYQSHKKFVDEMAAIKADACTKVSNLNFATAVDWTYGNGEGFNRNLTKFLNLQRMGAWPKSLLTAIRVRNLEALVNRPPVPSIDHQNVDELRQSPHEAVYNERPFKAFKAGFRNLGGGIKKEAGGSDQDELALSFTLTELSPEDIPINGTDLSSLLIPSQANLLREQYDKKYYLDLHILPVNYLIYYTTFISKSKDINYAGAGTDDAGCDNIKTALPVPSYIMGFVKNPNILTYYSVKAEAKFIGLFFPFYRTLGDGIQLKAYASAKPFGGRIGPKFFHEEFGALKARTGNLQELKSAAYLIGLEKAGSSLSGSGYPLPPNKADFYLNDKDQSIGGPINRGQTVVYAIPNMIYDFQNNLDEIITSPGGERFLKLKPANAFATAPSRPTSPPPQEERIGLYDWKQFDLFYKRTLEAALGTGPTTGTITTPQLLQAIQNALRPTLYEAVNWMIPLQTTSSNDMAAPTTVVIDPTGRVDDSYWLYAPLHGPGTLYNESTAIESVVRSYLADNRLSFDKYLNALKQAADEILAQGTDDIYSKAASGIYPITGTSGSYTTANGNMSPASARIFSCSPGTRPSMAAMFYHFFKNSDAVACGITPIIRGLREFISKIPVEDQRYLISDYSPPVRSRPEDLKDLSTTYYPGANQGADDEGNLLLPHINRRANHKRNYYSTKFIHTEKLLENRGSGISYGTGGGGPPLLKESIQGDATVNTPFENPLNIEDIREFQLNANAGVSSNTFAH